MYNDENLKQLEDICKKLLIGFNSWIEINTLKERSILLDNAHDFKASLIYDKKQSLQKLYFNDMGKMQEQEKIKLLVYWKKIFSEILNSKLDRISKDSFKIWFLSLASFVFPSLKKEGDKLWTLLIEALDMCQSFSIKDIPLSYNKILKN